MKRSYLAVATIIIIAIISVSAVAINQLSLPEKPQTTSALVGIAYCGNTVEQGKLLIDKVKDYTNLFVLQSGVLQRDLASVEELGNYAIDSGMYFMPYFGDFIKESLSSWLESVKAKWGDRFLGIYHGDEPGGKMLDSYVEYDNEGTGDSIVKTMYGDVVLQKANGVVINYQLDGAIRLSEPALGNDSNFNSEAVFYANGTILAIRPASNDFSYQTYEQLLNVRPLKDNDEVAQAFYSKDKNNMDFLRNATKVFTSDYGLYWFDYRLGYDVILAQIGWNISDNQQLAFLRGAANAQQKEWGIIITWKYQEPPYLDSGEQVLRQLQTAYDSGAKYLVLFNYYDDQSGTYGTMKDEHFEALRSFWTGAVNNPDVVHGSVVADSVVVFPKNYGWGARWEEDKVWGIFLADEQTKQLWSLMQMALQKHGLRTDIVYDDEIITISSMYQNFYYWDKSGN